MIKPIILTSSLLLSFAVGSGTAFAGNAQQAKQDCRQKLRGDSHYSHVRSMESEKQGHGKFRITGMVKDRRDGKDHSFSCMVRHDEVTSWYVTPPKGSGKHANAKEVGAGLLALAIVATIASTEDKKHNNKQNDYASGHRNPFRDMNYLKKECRREIRQHLREDHGRVDTLTITTAELNDRRLSGKAKVKFKNATRHKMNYTCKFNRKGEIHDGEYYYR